LPIWDARRTSPALRGSLDASDLIWEDNKRKRSSTLREKIGPTPVAITPSPRQQGKQFLAILDAERSYISLPYSPDRLSLRSGWVLAAAMIDAIGSRCAAIEGLLSKASLGTNPADQTPYDYIGTIRKKLNWPEVAMNVQNHAGSPVAKAQILMYHPPPCQPCIVPMFLGICKATCSWRFFSDNSSVW